MAEEGQDSRCYLDQTTVSFLLLKLHGQGGVMVSISAEGDFCFL